MQNNKVDKITNEQGTFTCPAVKQIQQLRGEIAELKNMLGKMPPNRVAMLDNSELMIQYHISRTTASEWRANGLGYIKIGRKLFFERESIDAFLQKHKHSAF
ncbi:MAG: helix-turn-helix domain-containing protein [Bacteroidia bacterium]